MAKLLGKAPNQVPTNADLGTMAFQDREGINVNNAIVANLVVTGATSVNTNFAVTNATSNVAYFSSNGNVGIGNSTPTFKMVVDGGAASVTSTIRSTSGYSELYLSGTTASYLSSNTSLNIWANGATRIFVAANGNVGINNTSPTEIFSVGGNFIYQKNSADAAGGIVLDTGSSAAQVSQILLRDRGTDKWVVRKNSSNDFDLYNSNTTSVAFTISGANGNFGVGNTAPDAKLAVTGTANISANVWIGGQVSVGANVIANTTALLLGNSTVNTVITQTTASFNANSTYGTLIVAANGNIGVGISAPTSRLHVNGNFRSVLSSQGDFTINHAGLVSTAGAVAGVQLALQGGGVEAIRIDTGANVGIGNTTPNAKLQVTGTANISGNVAISGSVTITGGTSDFILRNPAGGGGVDEGGELKLWLATNTTLNAISNTVSIDIYQNRLRIFETGSPNRGVYMDLSTAGAGVGTNLLAATGGFTNGQSISIANLTITGSLTSNGSTGTAGQVLTSNGTATYWSAASGSGATLIANTTDTQTFYFPMSNATTGSWTNGVVDAILSFVPSTNVLSLGAGSIVVGNSTVNTVLSSTSVSLGANSTTTALFVAANGNIGIGNATPGSKLTIAGATPGPITIGAWAAGYNAINLNGNNVGGAGASDYNILGDATSLFINRASGSMYFRLNNNDQMFLSSNGNFGIGNTAPAQKFVVNGTANIVGNTSLGGDLTVAGNLTVSGTTTYINTTTLNIGDNIITLNADVTGATTPTENAGIEINRGAEANATFIWNETSDQWQSQVGAVTKLTVSNTVVGVTGNAALTLGTTNGGTEGGELQFSAVSGDPARIIDIDGTNNWRFNSYSSNGSIIFNTQAGNAARLIIAANGNVGINNTAPNDVLSVNGSVQFTNSSASVFLAAANGNIGIGNTAPTDKLSIEGNIRANNLRRYTATRTLTTAVNDTVEIGTMYSEAGAHSLDITIQVTDSGFSVTKRYLINSPWNATNSTVYRKVLPFFDSGPFSNDYDLEAYHNNQTLALRVRRTSGSTTGTLEILIDDRVLQSEGTTLDYFTPSSTAASGVAAVTDVFPGSRIINTGVGSSNAFIVQANLTTAAITSNNSVTTFNLPVTFNNTVTIGNFTSASLGLVTSATTANQVLFTSSAAGYRTTKYLVQITSGSVYQATEIVLIHDGTNVYKSEYGQVFSGAVLATFDADINSGNVRLLTTPTNAVTTYKGSVFLVPV